MINRPFKTYNGGKNSQGVFQAIINKIPPHDVFISAFVGNCSILSNKLPASMANIAIDADAAVIQKWSVNPGVIAINGDARSLLIDQIAKYNDGGSKIFIFLDPPYLSEVRKTKTPYYKHEMDDITSHETLVQLLTNINAITPKVYMMLTHYPCKFYDDALSTWRQINITGRSRKGNTIERLYMNYQEHSQLHDIRFYGNNFRERELLSKAAKNLKKKFANWTPLQRQYFLYKLQEQPLNSLTHNSKNHATTTTNTRTTTDLKI